MHFDLGDGFGPHQYARESAVLNQRDGHQWSCAWAGGGGCTCGVCPPTEDPPTDAEMIAAGYVLGEDKSWLAPKQETADANRSDQEDTEDDCPF